MLLWVNGVPWLPLAILESLPLARECMVLPQVDHCFQLQVSVVPPCDCVVRPQVDRCFGILVLYKEKMKAFSCHSTSHLVDAPANVTTYEPVLHPRHGFPTLTFV